MARRRNSTVCVAMVAHRNEKFPNIPTLYIHVYEYEHDVQSLRLDSLDSVLEGPILHNVQLKQ